MDGDIFNKVKQFTIRKGAVEEHEVTANSSLANDLGIYGDDAVEFFIAFGKEFNVDVSNFMISEYFRPEGDVILPALVRAITGKKKKLLKNLTVSHLEKAVKAGRLDNDVTSD